MSERIGFKVYAPTYMASDPDRKKKYIAFRRGLLNVEELPEFVRWERRTSGFDTEFTAWIQADVDIDPWDFTRRATVAMGEGWQ
jgi:hypothetical protein